MFNLRGIILNNNLLKPEKDFIIGINSIKEAIAAIRNIDSILIANGRHINSIKSILNKAKELKIPVKNVDKKKLDFLCKNQKHQGIIAIVAAHKYSNIEEIFETAFQKKEPPFIVIADKIVDSHNLGAIIRTAECAGAHGIIIPNRHAAGLNFDVAKCSAGALEHIKIARVNNISETLLGLKKRGLWIFGADMDGQTYCQVDFAGPLALVVGNEGFGLSRLVKENCDVIVSVPICGKINSLNASVAAGIIMYEITRQRLNLLKK